jgi:hypothetical protein
MWKYEDRSVDKGVDKGVEGSSLHVSCTRRTQVDTTLPTPRR